MAKQYVLGRGKLYFDRFKEGTLTGEGERYIGNTPELSLSVESETLDHFSSEEGVREKDDSVTLELNRSGSFTTDWISPKNLSLFLLGDTQEVSETSQSAVTEQMTVYQGMYYQIGQDDANPTGVRGITVNSVTVDPSGTATSAVEGDDYTVEPELGRIHIVEGSGNISDGTVIEVDYDVSSSTRTQIVTAANANLDGAMRFIAYNPKGPNRDWYMPQVRLSPTGDFQLKGDEWQQIGFNMEVLKKSSSIQALYIDGRPV